MRAVGPSAKTNEDGRSPTRLSSKESSSGGLFAVFGSGGYRARRLASSVRWRSVRPPKVLLGKTRQLCRILVAFTRPYLGSASSMSNTFAV